MLIFAFFVPPLRAQNDFEIAKNVDIFVSILKELNAKYADEVSPGDLTKTAIDAMLAKLDPYTVYYPESQIEDYKLLTTGQYGGIGALIGQHGDFVVISEPYEGWPAQVAGLRAGDKILKINKQEVGKKKTDEVSAILKGQPGTAIDLEISRLGEPKPLTFHIIRKEIKLPNLPYTGMIDDQIGYIKLDQFTENAGNEVKTAFTALKEAGMRALILDLRNNGGGLLNEAVNIMNLFVGPNITIAETKGKIKEQQRAHKTTMPVIDADIPVVVLVNENSASASEIVAGAFQDLDRGVIVGKKTFGKGLVQNVLPLSYNSSLKITVSKYYIPSGRCVQNIDYFDKNDTLGGARQHIPDSLAVAYKTKNGRTVYDKGGIEPDIVTPDSLVSEILLTLIVKQHIFDFATHFRATHDSIAKPDQFVVDDALYQEFIDFLKDKDYSYTSDTENLLKALKTVATEDGNFAAIAPQYEEMMSNLARDKQNDLQKHKTEIAQYLAMEIVGRYYYQKGQIISTLANDWEVRAAKELLANPEKYKAILAGK